jgi:hypothetical protein
MTKERDLIERLAKTLAGLREHASMFNHDTDEMWVSVKEAVESVEAEADAYLSYQTSENETYFVVPPSGPPYWRPYNTQSNPELPDHSQWMQP